MSEVNLAFKIIKDYCSSKKKRVDCDTCPMLPVCYDDITPDYIRIPEPETEPEERSRIEWLRMLPDNELLKAIVYMTEHNCLHCLDRYNANCCGCAEGLVPWWQEKITLAQFRKDAELR